MIKKLPKSQIEIENTIPLKEWEKHLDSAVEEASKEIKVDGFRPGKAPRNIVEQKVGKEVILNGAAEKAIKKDYVDLVQKEKLEVIGSPKIDIVEIEEGKDLKYKAMVAVMPEVKIKESFEKDVKKVNQESAGETDKVEEKEIDLELEKLANSRVKLVTVRREAKKGDSVEVDFTVLREGVPIENGTSKKHPLIIGRGVFIPGFEEKIIGMKEGEEKEFELSFPENYHQKDLAGKPATFKVKMGLVQERQMPEINDDLATSLGNFKNLEELKKSIREGLEHERAHKKEEERRAKYIDEIIKSAEADLPDVLIEEEIKRMFAEFEQQLAPMGMNLDQYLSKLGKKREDLEKDWKSQAEKRVLGALILEEIAKMKEIKASSKEVEEEINKTLQYYKNVKDIEKNIDMERLYKYSRSMLENEKVFKYLEGLK